MGLRLVGDRGSGLTASATIASMSTGSDLGKVGKDKVAGFEGAMKSDYLVTSALVHDGVLYYKPSQTAQGAYPIPWRCASASGRLPSR